MSTILSTITIALFIVTMLLCMIWLDFRDDYKDPDRDYESTQQLNERILPLTLWTASLIMIVSGLLLSL